MPEEKKNVPAVPLTDEQRERVEDPNQIDETVPGGRYIVGDVIQNAHGEEIGKVSKADQKVDSAPEPDDTKKK
jgi:hypothetical protein